MIEGYYDDGDDCNVDGFLHAIPHHYPLRPTHLDYQPHEETKHYHSVNLYSPLQQADDEKSSNRSQSVCSSVGMMKLSILRLNEKFSLSQYSHILKQRNAQTSLEVYNTSHGL